MIIAIAASVLSNVSAQISRNGNNIDFPESTVVTDRRPNFDKEWNVSKFLIFSYNDILIIKEYILDWIEERKEFVSVIDSFKLGKISSELIEIINVLKGRINNEKYKEFDIKSNNESIEMLERFPDIILYLIDRYKNTIKNITPNSFSLTTNIEKEKIINSISTIRWKNAKWKSNQQEKL